jgi:hypothetical protein
MIGYRWTGMIISIYVFTSLALAGTVDFYPWRTGHLAETSPVTSVSMTEAEFSELLQRKRLVRSASGLYPGCFLAKWNRPAPKQIVAKRDSGGEDNRAPASINSSESKEITKAEQTRICFHQRN